MIKFVLSKSDWKIILVNKRLDFFKKCYHNNIECLNDVVNVVILLWKSKCVKIKNRRTGQESLHQLWKRSYRTPCISRVVVIAYYYIVHAVLLLPLCAARRDFRISRSQIELQSVKCAHTHARCRVAGTPMLWRRNCCDTRHNRHRLCWCCQRAIIIIIVYNWCPVSRLVG